MGRVLTTVSLVGLLACVGAAQVPAKITEEQFNEYLKPFLDSGMLADVEDFHKPPPTRYSLATSAYAIVARLTYQRSEWLARVRQLAFENVLPKEAWRTPAYLKEEASKASKYPRHFPRLKWLIRAMRVELTALGADPDQMLRQVDILEPELRRMPYVRIPVLGEAHQPFVDVPRGHWAHEATSLVRREGILVGDPNGKFGG